MVQNGRNPRILNTQCFLLRFAQNNKKPNYPIKGDLVFVFYANLKLEFKTT